MHKRHPPGPATPRCRAPDVQARATGEDPRLDHRLRPRRQDGGAPRTYLDYWWYFPYNPARSGEGAMCGAGLDIAGMTCFDHESDWEGVTVELDSTGLRGQPLAVLYAQHNGAPLTRGRRSPSSGATTRQRSWQGRRPAASPGLSRPRHPCVISLSLSGPRRRQVSHDARCPQTAGRRRSPTTDSTDIGRGRATVKVPARLPDPVPTRDEGRDPASWNAFAGHWGTADCAPS